MNDTNRSTTPPQKTNAKHTAVHFTPGFKSLCGRNSSPQAVAAAVTCARCVELFAKESATGAHLWALDADTHGATLPRAHVAQLFRVAAAFREEKIQRARDVVETEMAEQAKCVARAAEIEAEVSR